MKKKILVLLKLIFTLGLFYYLFQKVPVELVTEKLTSVDVFWLVIALLSYSLSSFISAARWCHIAKSLEVSLTYKSALKLYYLGNFFNQILPSGIGGDAVKAVAIARGKETKSPAVHSVLLERAAGLGVLVGILTLCFPVIYTFFPSLGYLVLMLAMGALVSVVAYFVFIANINLLLKRKVTAWIGRLLVDIQKAFGSLTKFAYQVTTSVLVQLLSVFCLYACARAVGADVAIIHMLAFAPLMFLLLVLPVSFGGWGLREGVAVMLFAGASVMSEADALTMSLLMGVVVIAASLPGGLFLSEFRKKHP